MTWPLLRSWTAVTVVVQDWPFPPSRRQESSETVFERSGSSGKSSRSRGCSRNSFRCRSMNSLDFWVLIGDLEHHRADEDLAAGVCFPFAG